MTRLALIPAALAAGPAFAHGSGQVHLHEYDNATLLLGFSLLGLGAGAAALMRVRKR